MQFKLCVNYKEFSIIKCFTRAPNLYARYTPVQERATDELEKPIMRIDGAKLDHIYRPVWDAQKEVISTYLIVSRKTFEDKSRLYDYWSLPNSPNLPKLANHESNMIIKAIDAIEDGIFFNKPFSIIPPIVYKSYIFSDNHAAYHRALSGISDQVRSRLHLRIIITDHVARPCSIFDKLKPLNEYCKSFILHTPGMMYVPSITLPRNVSAIGTSASLVSQGEDPLGAITQFAEGAARTTAPALLTGVPTKKMALEAVRLGYRYIAGPFLGNDLDGPSAIRTMTPADFPAPDTGPNQTSPREQAALSRKHYGPRALN